MHMHDGNPCLRADPGTRNLQFMEPTEALPLEPCRTREVLQSGIPGFQQHSRLVWADSRSVDQLPSLKFPEPLSFSSPNWMEETDLSPLSLKVNLSIKFFLSSKTSGTVLASFVPWASIPC